MQNSVPMNSAQVRDSFGRALVGVVSFGLGLGNASEAGFRLGVVATLGLVVLDF
jgi:putative effector of murein hydrolase